MKKIAIWFVPALVLIVGISLVAYAGATKVEFFQTSACATVDGGIHADAEGFVIINKTPKGAIEFVIQIQLRDAAPEWEYAVYSGANLLGTFTTNRRGSGGVHCNLPDDKSGSGLYVNIWNSVKPATRLLRAEVP